MFMSKAFCFINTLEIVYCTTDATIFPVSIFNANPCTDCELMTAGANVQNTSGWFLFRADTRQTHWKTGTLSVYVISSLRHCFFYFVGVCLFITMPNHTIVEYLKVYILCGLLKRHFNSENDVKNKICGVLCKCILLESVSLSLDSGINSSSRQSIISKPWIFEFRGLKWN